MRSGTAIVAGLLVLCAAPASAQVNAIRGLDFGTVITGTTTSISPSSAGAAQFHIYGILLLSGNISFTLPTTLVRAGGGSMAVTYCSTCALYRVGTNNPVGATVFDPKVGTGLVVSLLSHIYIWLGASVSPPLNQVAGSYSGTVVITVAGLL
jgi:hypothetical protein